MAFDPLIKTRVVSIGKGWGALGEVANISITIRAILPVTHIVWTETGDVMTRNPDVAVGRLARFLVWSRPVGRRALPLPGRLGVAGILVVVAFSVAASVALWLAAGV